MQGTNANESFQNIALIRLSSVGDVIMALPALEAVREAYPKAKITWIVERRARNVLEQHPALDDIIEFPRHVWRAHWKQPVFGHIKSVPSIARFFWGLRRRRFDLSIDFQGNLKSGFCTLASRARVRVGYARSECNEPNYLFTNRRLSLEGQAIHRMERDLLLTGLAGVPFVKRRPRIQFSVQDRTVGDALIPNPHQAEPIVMLHPGTSDFMPHKRWPLASYAALGDQLAAEANARILLSWGPNERSMAEEIQATMSYPAEIIPNTPSMKSLGWALRRADLVVGSDTGPIHLAVALGVPVIEVLGPSDPRHYYPLGHPERAFYRRTACSPCRNRDCQQRDCMTGISPSNVAREAIRVLNTQKR